MVSRGKTELRLDLTAADGKTVYKTFQNFRLGEKPYYTLHIDNGVRTGIHCHRRFDFKFKLFFTVYAIIYQSEQKQSRFKTS
jgi:hypothetical protein